MKKRNQAGFGHLGIFLLLAVIAVVALAGFYVHNRNADNSLVGISITKKASAKIQSANDAKAASSSLDTLEQKNNLDTTQLDNDLNSLL